MIRKLKESGSEMQKLKLEDLKPAPYNPRKIDDKSKKALFESIKKFGDISGIVWNKTTGNLVCGHQRLEVLKQKYPDLKIVDNVIIAGGKKFPIRIVEWDIETEKLANIAAYSQYVAGEFDYPKLDDILGELKLAKMDDIKLLRLDELLVDSRNSMTTETESEKLSDRFLVPPFTVLDARQGYWKDRKRAWLALGIQSELGRGGENLLNFSKLINDKFVGKI